ncbi:MAG: hypothetical protein JWP97_4518 [Labilithrix sp.]|nr:hypothetical protein [Labilithrix sp.]
MSDRFIASTFDKNAAREREIRARRRIVVRVGFAALAALTAVTALTACIFDQSDYQGGGHNDKGAQAKTAEPPASTEPTTQPTATSTTDDDSGLPILDATTG